MGIRRSLKGTVSESRRGQGDAREEGEECLEKKGEGGSSFIIYYSALGVVCALLPSRLLFSSPSRPTRYRPEQTSGPPPIYDSLGGLRY